jgi:hypothetical protein
MTNELIITQYARDLSKNKKIVDLVKMMHPLDVAKVLQKNFDIKPKEAAYLFAHFVKESDLVEWTGTRSKLSGSQ